MERASISLDLFCDGNTMPKLPWSEWEEKNPLAQSERFYHQVEENPELSFCRFFETKNTKLFYKLSNECIKWVSLYKNQFPTELDTVWSVGHFFRKKRNPLTIHLSEKLIGFLHDMEFKFDYSIYPGGVSERRKRNSLCLSLKENEGNKNRVEKLLNFYSIRDKEISVIRYKNKYSVSGIFFYGDCHMQDFHDFLEATLQFSQEQNISWRRVHFNLDYFPTASYSCIRLYEDTIKILSQLKISLDVTIHTPEKLCSKEYSLFPLFKKFQRCSGKTVKDESSVNFPKK
ncbi:hypothetical protein [Akkermansia sp.]|uniref:hypothetical protein n=1 Tax=Akkermansia sp. TaxID=1872421 RepID=UPI003AB83661